MPATFLSPPPPPPPSHPVCNASLEWDEEEGHCGGGARGVLVDSPSSTGDTGVIKRMTAAWLGWQELRQG